MAKYIYIAQGNNYWQSANTQAEAITKLGQACKGSRTAPARIPAVCFKCPPETQVSEIDGSLSYPHNAEPPTTVWRGELSKSTGKMLKESASPKRK